MNDDPDTGNGIDADEILLISDIITAIDDRLDRARSHGRQVLRPRAYIYARVLFAIIDSVREPPGRYAPGLLATPLLDPVDDDPVGEEVTALDRLIDLTIDEHTASAN